MTGASPATRILVLDGHGLSRHGLDVVLAPEPDLDIVATTGDLARVPGLIARHAPTLLVLDPMSPEFGGPSVCVQLAQAHPGLALCVLTTTADPSVVMAAVRAGARGFLLKHRHPDEIVSDLKAVAQGETRVSPPVLPVALAQLRLLAERVDRADTEATAPRPNLTDREQEVLRLVAAGGANKEIAHRLFISENTVKNHVRSILDKLQVHSRTEAALFAQRTGLLEADVESASPATRQRWAGLSERGDGSR